MNIFATYNCPIKSATVLDNLRVNKMILESAQMLSTVSGGPLKATHVNHPCTKWAQDPSNFYWLCRHMNGLLGEFQWRSKKFHAYESLMSGFFAKCDTSVVNPDNFVNVTPFSELEVHEAYRKTLEKKWANDKRPPKWGTSIVFEGWS